TWSPGRSASHPRARAAAAAVAVMLPLNESGASRTRTACPGVLPCGRGCVRRGRVVRGLVRREVEGLADLLLDLRLATAVVDRDHVLLAREQLEHRVGLLVVLAQPDRERLLGVVLPLDQGAAADVTDALLRRSGGDEVVVHAAVGAQAAGEYAAPDLGVGQ